MEQITVGIGAIEETPPRGDIVVKINRTAIEDHVK